MGPVVRVDRAHKAGLGAAAQLGAAQAHQAPRGPLDHQVPPGHLGPQAPLDQVAQAR